MIHESDASTSTLHLLVWQALKMYQTKGLIPLLEDEDPIVRTAVARELQIRGCKAIFDRVIKHCDDERNFVREIAAFTLGQLGAPAYPFRSESIPKLAILALDHCSEVRAASVGALGHLHAVESKEILLNAARDVSPEVRANAAVSLGRLGSSPDVLQTLLELLKDPIEEVREWAALGIDLAHSSPVS